MSQSCAGAVTVMSMSLHWQACRIPLFNPWWQHLCVHAPPEEAVQVQATGLAV